MGDVDRETYEIAQLGEFFEDFVLSKEWTMLTRHIFDVLDMKAFETFKKIDPADTTGIMQAQMMSKMIDEIKKEISKLVEQGRLARHNTRTLPEEDVL